MTEPPCDRFAREHLADLGDELPAEAAAHVAGCASCHAAAGRYRRVAELVAGAGRSRSLPDGWDGRLLARLEADRRPRRRWLAPAIAAGVAAAAAIVIAAGRGGSSASGRVALAGRVERGGQVLRALGPQPGDQLAVEARTARWTHAELRLYRNDRELVWRCSDAPPCRRDRDRLTATLPLDSAGRYRVLLIVGDGPAPPPLGAGLDRDAASAMDAGGPATVRLGEPIDVR